MDRVRALVEKLNDQLHQNADKASLTITVQQLLTELGGAVSAKPLPPNIYESELQDEQNSVPFLEELVRPNSDIIADLSATEQMIEATKLEDPTTEFIQPSSFIIETSQNEVMDKIVLEPIKDLRLAIGINDKFQFIQELFGGDEKSFELGVKTINAFKIFPEAQFYIKKEFREKNNWDEDSKTVKQFDQFVKRRFS